MSHRISTISYAGPTGDVQAHLIRPSGHGPWPGIVLLQEGLGVTAHLRSVAERLAEQGHIVLVPNLYSHEPARAALSDEAVTRFVPLARAADREAQLVALPPVERAVATQVVTWFNARHTATHLPDAEAGVTWLRTQPDVHADAVAAVGFSLGGGLVAQLAAGGASLAAGVIFYGSGPAVEHAPQVRVPLQGHYAGNDAAITSKVTEITGAVTRSGGSFSSFIYPGTEHGFFNETRPVHHAPSAALAWERTLGFLRTHLKRDEVRRAAG